MVATASNRKLEPRTRNHGALTRQVLSEAKFELNGATYKVGPTLTSSMVGFEGAQGTGHEKVADSGQALSEVNERRVRRVRETVCCSDPADACGGDG